VHYKFFHDDDDDDDDSTACCTPEIIKIGCAVTELFRKKIQFLQHGLCMNECIESAPKKELPTISC